jgi:hypothetical protein
MTQIGAHALETLHLFVHLAKYSSIRNTFQLTVEDLMNLQIMFVL